MSVASRADLRIGTRIAYVPDGTHEVERLLTLGYSEEMAGDHTARQCEQAQFQALDHPWALPLDHQAAWVSAQQGHSFLLPVPDSTGECRASVAVQVDRSRVLPGHHFLRVARFGHGCPPSVWENVVSALATYARGDRRILRLNLELFLRSGMPEMREILTRYGFTPTQARSYRYTLTMPVNSVDEALLANRKSLRKRLRDAEKGGVFIATLTDTSYADRIEELQRIAMKRSGGSFRIPDWTSILRFSAAQPELSRVVGLFTSATQTTPADLLGFGWGCMHTDHAEYRAAGSADLPQELRNVSISHPLLWQLIRWSRDNGATWLDLGGVTLQSGSEDPLEGISRAKRIFSETVEEVGEEWMLEPHPWKSRTAKTLGAIAGRLTRLRSK